MYLLHLLRRERLTRSPLPCLLLLSRVEVSEDTKIPNAATFKFPKQDHTLANMIRGSVASLPDRPGSAVVAVASQDRLAITMLTRFAFAICVRTVLFSHLLKDPTVLFAGYKHPHPLEPYFILKVQTVASTSPVKALQLALKELLELTIDIEDQWAAERQRAQVAGWQGEVGGVSASSGAGEGFGFGGGRADGGGVGGGGGGVYGGDMDF